MLPLAEAEARLARYWRPWHARIDSLMTTHVARFGEAILIDCHSMPHEALEGAAFAGRARPQIVLGDRFGTSARADIVDRIEAAFRDAGFRVARNAPFAGAFSVERYGRPAERRHVVQIEIDRALYLDERRVERGPGFAETRRKLGYVIAAIAAIGRDARPLAAE
jgi:N-formylglutamate amidohydrolase